MIIDHDDLVAAGIIKTASPFLEDADSAKYAIVLSTPSGYVGKFNVSTREDIVNSINALDKTASELPSDIVVAAKCYISKAANIAGVDVPWDDVKPYHTNIIKWEDIVPAPQPHYVLKIASHQPVLVYDSKDYDVAVDMFKTSGKLLNGRERICVASSLLKTAMELNVPCDSEVSAYAYASYSSNAQNLLDRRIASTHSEDAKQQYGVLKQAFDTLGDKMPPDMFIDAIECADAEAGIKHPTYRFFEQ